MSTQLVEMPTYPPAQTSEHVHRQQPQQQRVALACVPKHSHQASRRSHHTVQNKRQVLKQKFGLLAQNGKLVRVFGFHK